MSSTKFNRNIKGRISTMANWSGGRAEEENEEPQAFGEKLRRDMEVATAKVPIQEIDLDLLVDNPYQHLARRVMDDESLQELVDSIKNNGFYGALLARRKPGVPGKLEVAYGHRRKVAAERAGLKTVPVKVVELSDIEMARIMASENFSRLDLDPMGEADVVGFLADQQNLSAREIAPIVGKKRGWVESRLALHNAPAAIKQMVEQKPASFSHVPLLLRLKKDLNQLNQFAQQVIADQLTVEELKERIDFVAKAKPGASLPASHLSDKFASTLPEGIVNNSTISMLHGNSDTIHNTTDEPDEVTANSRVGLKNARSSRSKKADQGSNQHHTWLHGTSAPDEDDIETQLTRLEELVNHMVRGRKSESLSWSVRSRIQRVSQTLKDLVGGD